MFTYIGSLLGEVRFKNASPPLINDSNIKTFAMEQYANAKVSQVLGEIYTVCDRMVAKENLKIKTEKEKGLFEVLNEELNNK